MTSLNSMIQTSFLLPNLGRAPVVDDDDDEDRATLGIDGDDKAKY